MEIRSIGETQNSDRESLIMETFKNPGFHSPSNYISYSSVKKKLSTTISTPTTSADKKFVVIEKSKEKFHPIPLHGARGHLGLSVIKQSANNVENNPKTVKKFPKDYASLQIFREALRNYVILCKNAVMLWFSVLTYSFLFNRNSGK
ncbi:uncharacterized protein LOC117169471 [Belonocnema kinseyi]|uniref:uncharacterized protein LOC117169471 n=1 Tax=Belonocnema kinseyi TaxID=2817044 RepID=UPI00143D2059|nr:uncharacterized protein LOC117169471 [Belonocnema kinseyi]